eukprot:TRINITY_DN302_c0_g1_i1.p1 TRINITY_DN302_c0_g1~~TRINITY_DN302_c0_g1_i1.p1  ORF type:complete len:421 (-),score=117.62 TRINITY_DN302_c0_g1_i1:1245-2360(-)
MKEVVKGADYQTLLAGELNAFRSLSASPHPNIVRCYDHQETESHVFFIQEYLSGGELYTKLAENFGPFEPPKTKKTFYSMVKAVSHLHSLGIVHRDLKLENFCFDGEGNLKLIDFNLSATWSPDAFLSSPCGSTAYASPEIHLATSYRGPEVDMWSLGVILYLLLYFKFPFALTDEEENEREKEAKARRESGEPVEAEEEWRRKKVQQKIISGKFSFPSEEQEEENMLVLKLQQHQKLIKEQQRKKQAGIKENKTKISTGDMLYKKGGVFGDVDSSKCFVVPVEPSARVLVSSLLEVDASKRADIRSVMSHPWLDEAKKLEVAENEAKLKEGFDKDKKKTIIKRSTGEKEEREEKSKKSPGRKFLGFLGGK